MRYRIRRFSIHQTSTMAAILYAVMGLIFLPFIWLATRFAPQASPMPMSGTGFLIALPIIYGVFGYIMTAIMLAIYNLVAGMVGGVEAELVAVSEPVA